MKSLRKLPTAIAAVTAVLLTGACSNDICTDNQNSLPRAQFVNADLDAQISPDTIAIMGVGAPNDSLLYKAGTRLTDIYLPLRPNYESTSYLFHYTGRDTTDPDTGEVTEDHTGDDLIVITYTTTPIFSGADCGAMYRYYITDMRHTTHGIDKIIISDPVITNTDMVRIYIAMKQPEAPTAPDDTDSSEDTGDEDGENGADGTENIGNDDNSATAGTPMRGAVMGLTVKGGDR